MTAIGSCLLSVVDLPMYLCPSEFAFIETRFETTDLLLETSKLYFYKAREKSTGKRVILKFLKARFPSSADLAKLQNHFAIVQELSSEYSVQALECWREDGITVLVLEDLGGGSLRHFTERRLYSSNASTAAAPYLQVFHIALKIAQCLAYLEQRNVCHGNLNPDSIWANLAANSIRLCDFSYAQRERQLHADSWHRDHDERAAEFLAPELNVASAKTASLQADFYALGSLLRFMINARSFNSAEPDSARTANSYYPASFHAVVDLSAPGASILETLMQKLLHAERDKRYSNTQQLIKDLKRCIAWLDSGVVELQEQPLTLGEEQAFQVGDTLYGRDAELAVLEEALESSCHDSSLQCSFKVVKITGRAGMGKSVLAQNFLHAAMNRGCRVAQGQYGQYRSDEPLSALLDALSALLVQLLSEPLSLQLRWREKLVSAMQGQAAVLVDLLPSLGELMGPQPELPAISGEMAARRFSQVLRQFLSVFYQPGCPLVLYLDDLQWADQSSIKLLNDLCSSMDDAHLLLVLAYRNDQSIALLPGRNQFLELAAQRPCTVVVELAALKQGDIANIVADTLRCSRAKAGPLARLVEQKTTGDPFYVRQFLYALHREGQITYSSQDNCWVCDLSAVRRASLTEHVVSFMSNRLLELDPETLEVLQVMSCLGTSVDLLSLSQSMDKSRLSVARLIWSALCSGLVVLERDVYKFQHSANDDEPVDEFTVLYGDGLEYCLLHDRVRQAAYNLIPAAERGKWHARIGRRLLAHYQRGGDDRSLFDILDKLGIGLEYIDDLLERKAMVALFQQAGIKARAYIAYDESLNYFQRGIEIVGPDCWNSDRGACVQLYLEAATSALQASRFSTAFSMLEEIESRLNTPIEILQHAILQVQLCCLVNKLNDALEQGYKSLQRYGSERLPAQRLGYMLGPESVELVLDTQKLAELEDQFALQLLLSMTPAAFYSTAEAYRELVVTQLQFMIDRGACSNHSLSICNYGTLFLGGAEHERAEALFEQTFLLEKQLPDAEVIRHKSVLANSFYRHWHKPLREVVADSEFCATECVDRGDYTFAAYAAIFLVEKSFFCCQSLGDFEKQVGDYATFTGHVLHQVPHYQLGVWHQFALNLSEGSLEPAELEGRAFSERQSLSVLEGNNNEMILFYLYFSKALLALHFDQPLAASRNISKAKQTLQSCSATYCGSVLQVYEIIIAFGAEGDAPALQLLSEHRAELASGQRRRAYSQQHFELFLQAIEHAAAGQLQQARETYLQAVDVALQGGMVHDALLMKEGMARCSARTGQMEQASELFEECYHDYQRWGARAKADHLRRQFSAYMPMDLSL